MFNFKNDPASFICSLKMTKFLFCKQKGETEYSKKWFTQPLDVYITNSNYIISGKKVIEMIMKEDSIFYGRELLQIKSSSQKLFCGFSWDFKMSKVTSLVKQVSGLTPEVSKKVAAMVGAVVGDAASIHLRKSKFFREIELYFRISRGFFY